MLVKIINRPNRWWPYVVLGIVLGLSMTVKYTLILVPLELVIVGGVLAYQNKLGWTWALRRLAAVAALAILGLIVFKLVVCLEYLVFKYGRYRGLAGRYLASGFGRG